MIDDRELCLVRAIAESIDLGPIVRNGSYLFLNDRPFTANTAWPDAVQQHAIIRAITGSIKNGDLRQAGNRSPLSIRTYTHTALLFHHRCDIKGEEI